MTGELVVDLFLTLDQVMQAPGGPDEDPSGGFPFGGWQAAFQDAEGGADIVAQVRSMDALLLGRRTYDIFAGYWPKAPADDPVAIHLNGVPKYVASRTLGEPTWAGTTVLREPALEVAALKERHREIHLIGSGDLLQTLLAADVVDVLNLWLYPVTLGTGRRVFEGGAIPASFTLDAAPAGYASGAVHLRYRRAGDVVTGRMGPEIER